MTGTVNQLFPLFRSQLSTTITNLVFTSADGMTITELSEVTATDRRNVRNVVDSLVTAGVFSERRVGRTRLITPNEGSPVYAPLLQLLTIVEGPPALVAEALREVPQVIGAYIYGSWAARANGVPGVQPRDVDVLVITQGRASVKRRAAVIDALDNASSALYRPVNPTFATVEQWNESDDSFLRDIKSGPIIEALPVKEAAMT